ncbi:hypothetical protein N9J72_02945, partial [Candidatus Gracilibacteria bacterium]|nr:hypothetical protein [Candidatus Gracilibacteria bacterium]
VHLVYIKSNPKNRLCLIDDPDIFLSFVEENSDINIVIGDINPKVFQSPKVLEYVAGFGTHSLMDLPDFVFQDDTLCLTIAKIGESKYRELFRQMTLVGKKSAEDIKVFIESNSGGEDNNSSIFNKNEALKNLPRDIQQDVYEAFGIEQREQHNVSNPSAEAVKEITKLREIIGKGETSTEDFGIVQSNILYYIEKYDITLSDIGNDIKLLIDTNRCESLLGKIFQNTDINNQRDKNIVKYFINKSDGNFAFLPRTIQQNPDILYEFGKLGSNAMKFIPSGLFENQEQFGSFFAGYVDFGNADYGKIRKNEKFGNIFSSLNTSDTSGLSQKSLIGIIAYKEYVGQMTHLIQENSNTVKGAIDGKKEITLKLEVGKILENIQIPNERIDFLLPLIEENPDRFFQGLYDFLEKNNVSIQDIKQQIVQVSTSIEELYSEIAQKKRGDAESLEGVTKSDIEILKKLGYISEGIFEVSLVEKDFNTYFQENGKENLDVVYSEKFIEEFLVQKGIPKSKHEIIIESFIAAYKAQTEAARTSIYTSTPTENFEDTIKGGVNKQAKERVYQNILRGGSILPISEDDVGKNNGEAENSSNEGEQGNQHIENKIFTGENGISMIESNGVEIKLSSEEAQAMRDNPETRENFIKTDTFFEEKGIPSAWREYRHEIVGAMNMNSVDIQINLNDDSLGTQELLKFTQFVYKIIYGKNSSPINKQEELGNKLQYYTGVGTKDTSMLGDRFITDLNNIGINKNLSSGQISEQLFQLANGEGLESYIIK